MTDSKKTIFVERLLRVADKLEGLGPYEKDGPIKDDEFNIYYFYSEGHPLDYECKTVACACGYAGLDPWFWKQGFMLEIDTDWSEASKLCLYTPGTNNRIACGFQAIQKFFGLNQIEAEYLFSHLDYETERGTDGKITPTPKDVAQRIREFVQKKESS